MVAIEEILWNIFTYYSLNGNPRDPSRLHSTGLLKFCKDIMTMDNTMTERSLTQAELQLIYTAAIKSPEKVIYIHFLLHSNLTYQYESNRVKIAPKKSQIRLISMHFYLV